MIAILLSALLAPAWAGEQPPVPPDIRTLHDTALESIDNKEKSRAIQQIAMTPPASLRDLPLLFDLFMRVPDPAAREAVLASVALIGPESSYLEPGFLEFLKLQEPEAVLFGAKGLTRLKSKRAVSELRRLIKGRFKARSAEDLSLPGERNAWWLRYEALNALALIEGPGAFETVKAKVDETPAVARIMASVYWKRTLPLILLWSQRAATLDRAHEALRSSGSTADLRETRGLMLSALRDPKVEREVRHQLALKVGVTSKPEEVAELLKEHAAAADPDTKLMLMAALFASRDPQIIPLLKEQARSNPDPQVRMGSLIQIKDMIPAEDFHALAQAMAKDDADADNRKEAASLK